MAVVTVTELAAYMSGINMTPANKQAAQTILDGVQADLEMYLNRPVTARHVREQVMPDINGFARLSVTPVVAVLRVIGTSSTTITGTALDPMEELDVPDGHDPIPQYDLVPMNYGVEMIVPGGVMVGFQTQVIVEYVGGGSDFIAPYMPAIRIAMMRVASRDFQQMSDDTMSLRDTNASAPADPVAVQGRGWQPEELVAFDRLRRRVVL